MDDTTEDLIVKGGIAVGVFVFVIKPIMNYLGIDSTDQSTINNISSLSADQNPFSINFITANIAAYPALNFITWNNNSAYWVNAKAAVDNGQGDQVSIWAQKVYDSFHWYWIYGDDVYSVFTNVPDKATVCQMAQYIYFNYQRDLFILLRDGVYALMSGPLSNGLPSSMLAEIINHVNTLPVIS